MHFAEILKQPQQHDVAPVVGLYRLQLFLVVNLLVTAAHISSGYAYLLADI